MAKRTRKRKPPDDVPRHGEIMPTAKWTEVHKPPKEPTIIDGEVVAKPALNLPDKMIRWHHAIAQVTGGLSLRISKHTITAREIDDWANTLLTTAKEMKETVNDITR